MAPVVHRLHSALRAAAHTVWLLPVRPLAHPIPTLSGAGAGGTNGYTGFCCGDGGRSRVWRILGSAGPVHQSNLQGVPRTGAAGRGPVGRTRALWGREGAGRGRAGEGASRALRPPARAETPPAVRRPAGLSCGTPQVRRAGGPGGLAGAWAAAARAACLPACLPLASVGLLHAVALGHKLLDVAEKAGGVGAAPAGGASAAACGGGCGGGVAGRAAAGWPWPCSPRRQLAAKSLCPHASHRLGAKPFSTPRPPPAPPVAPRAPHSQLDGLLHHLAGLLRALDLVHTDLLVLVLMGAGARQEGSASK
jgi:hypothetical protein